MELTEKGFRFTDSRTYAREWSSGQLREYVSPRWTTWSRWSNIIAKTGTIGEDYNRFDLSDSVWTLIARKPFFPLAMIMRLARTKEGGNA